MTPEQQAAIARAEAIARAKAKAGLGGAYGSSDMALKKARIDAARAGTLQIPQERLDAAEAANQKSLKMMDEAYIQSIPGGVAAGALIEGVQGIPLVGEYLDEAIGLVSPRGQQNMRNISNAMENAYPKTSIAAGITGNVVSAIPLATTGAAAKAASWIGKGATRVTQLGRAATVGAGAGASEGAVSFAGRGETQQERIAGAKTGAAVGGALGGILGVVAPLVGEGAANLSRRIKKLDVRTIAEEFGVSPAAARSVREALLNDDLDTAVARLAELGDDAMLADAGPATQTMLDAAARTGGEALRVTQDAVNQRATQVAQRLPGKLDSILGQPTGIRAAAEEIAKRTAPARQAAYDRAYSSAINYADDAGRAIEDVLTRIPAKTLKAAIDEANDAMQAAGARNAQIMAEIAEDGSVTFREMPNVQQLDNIKRALDDIARGAVDQWGRPNAQGVRASRLAAELRDAIGNAVPAFKAALKVGGDKVRTDEALDLGSKLLFKGTSVEDVRRFMASGVSDEARQAIKAGLRNTIETNLANIKRTITDPNVDAREAMSLLKEMSSRANTAKVRMALGPTDAKVLLDELDKQATVLALRAATAQNSQTAIRQAVQGQVKAEAAPGTLRQILGTSGNPLDAGRKVTEWAAGLDPRSIGDVERGIFAEIARSLTGIRGDDAARALTVVRRAMAGQPLKDAEAQLIGRVVAGVVGAGGYRAATQPRRPQLQ